MIISKTTHLINPTLRTTEVVHLQVEYLVFYRCQVRKGAGSQVDVILNKEVSSEQWFCLGWLSCCGSFWVLPNRGTCIAPAQSVPMGMPAEGISLWLGRSMGSTHHSEDLCVPFAVNLYSHGVFLTCFDITLFSNCLTTCWCFTIFWFEPEEFQYSLNVIRQVNSTYTPAAGWFAVCNHISQSTPKTWFFLVHNCWCPASSNIT